jgi:hypothetical protein
MSGVSYTKKNNGATRTGSDLPFLEFAADVAAPSANRRLRWDGTGKTLVASAATSSIASTDTPTWNMFVQLKAYAKDRYIRGIHKFNGNTLSLFRRRSAQAFNNFGRQFDNHLLGRTS